jgi:hypothetical protein
VTLGGGAPLAFAPFSVRNLTTLSNFSNLAPSRAVRPSVLAASLCMDIRSPCPVEHNLIHHTHLCLRRGWITSEMATTFASSVTGMFRTICITS